MWLDNAGGIELGVVNAPVVCLRGVIGWGRRVIEGGREGGGLECCALFTTSSAKDGLVYRCTERCCRLTYAGGD